MTKSIRSIVRSAGAVLAGYAVIAVLTSLGFAPLGGIVHVDADARIQVLGVLVALGAGLLGGAAAAVIAASNPVQHASAVLIFLTIDTAAVLSRPRIDPLWFDLAGSAILMLSAIAGGILIKRARRCGSESVPA
jgi:hypothetical protein